MEEGQPGPSEVKVEAISAADVFQMLSAMRQDMANMESRIKQELRADVQAVVRHSMANADEVLANLRDETLRNTEAVAQRQRQLEAGVGEAFQMTQHQLQNVGMTAYGAAHTATVTALTTDRLLREGLPVPGPSPTSASMPGTSRAGVQAGFPGDPTAAAIYDLLTWLKDPASRVESRVPTLPEGTPYFNGRNPSKEGVDAAGFIRSLESFRLLSKPTMVIGDGMLILMATSRFKIPGRANTWWQTVLVDSEKHGLPFTNWEGFRALFLEEMKQPDEAIAIRMELEKISLLNSRGYRDYVYRIQTAMAKLENIGAPLSLTDQLMKFSKGLLSQPKLYMAAPLDAPSLKVAMSKVTNKFNSLELKASLEGKPGLDEQRGRGQHRQRRNDEQLYALDDDEEYPAEEEDYEEGEQPWDDEEDYDGDLAAVQMRGVGRRGRGRGRGGRFGAGRGRGGRGRGPGGPGRGQPGGARGRGVKGRVLTPQQLEWYNDQRCVLCGSKDHYAADCPNPAQGNA